MGGVFSMLMEGILVLKGKEPRRLKCWEGYEHKRKKKKEKEGGEEGRGDILLVRKTEGQGTFWVKRMGESFSTVDILKWRATESHFLEVILGIHGSYLVEILR